MKKLTTEEFIERANRVHNNKYDYSKTKYKTAHDSVEITCPQHMHDFNQKAWDHLNGTTGCVQCATDKTIKTNLVRYNVENVSQFDEIKEKKIQTTLKHYKVENPFQSEMIKTKSKETNLKNYGVEYAMQNNIIKENTRSTNLQRYGFANPQQSPLVQLKTQITNLNRYGCKFTLQNSNIKKKANATIYEKYNVAFISQRHISEQTLFSLNDRSWLKNQHHVLEKTLEQIGYEIGAAGNTVKRYLLKHDIEHKQFNQSTGEKEVSNFLKILKYKLILGSFNIIPPYQIDIFIPSLNIALEYNGLYWHKNKGIDYHKNKTAMCNSQNIPLMHIWEDQWNDNQKETKENIIKFLNNVPQHQLTEEIEIDLATDNPQIYAKMGYNIVSQTEPQLYSEDVWDCGKMHLIK